MTDRMARLMSITAEFNRGLDALGMEFSGIVFDPLTKRDDGKLEFYAVQNIPDGRSDLLMQGYMAIREDPASNQVEDFYHITGNNTVQ